MCTKFHTNKGGLHIRVCFIPIRDECVLNVECVIPIRGGLYRGCCIPIRDDYVLHTGCVVLILNVFVVVVVAVIITLYYCYHCGLLFAGRRCGFALEAPP